eukprot:5812068-Heterocapsa_arctica.AAC.1
MKIALHHPATTNSSSGMGKNVIFTPACRLASPTSRLKFKKLWTVAMLMPCCSAASLKPRSGR